MVDNHNLEKIQEIIKKKSWLKLAFLFGSQAKGRGLSESDYDVAIWPEEKTKENEIDQLWIELERLLKKSVDLVNLNSARPTIAGEAFRGIPLLIRDERFYLNKMLEATSEAEDFQDFVMEIWKAREEQKS